jgi:hypothetical protein
MLLSYRQGNRPDVPPSLLARADAMSALMSAVRGKADVARIG